MQKEYFAALKAHITSELPQLKKVALYNSQILHLLSAQPNENPFGFPSAFIEMQRGNFKDLGQGVQEFDMNVVIHLAFHSLKTEDENILELNQQVYNAIQRFQYGYYSKLLKREETADYDHPNVQVYTSVFYTHGKDYTGKAETISTTATLSLTATTALTGVTNY